MLRYYQEVQPSYRMRFRLYLDLSGESIEYALSERIARADPYSCVSNGKA